MLDARRQRLLEAMGVTLYRRRGTSVAAEVRAWPGAEALVQADSSVDTTGAESLALVIVGARADRAHTDTLARALALAPSRLAFVEATPASLTSSPPQAGAYLAMGAAFARPLGAELPTTVQKSAQIVVTSAPAEWRNASAKRVLWQTLKPLRRALTQS